MNSSAGRNLNVLVIDDEPDIRSVLEDFLSSSHCKVRLADNSVTAMKLLLETKFDVVLSDIHMPGKSGLQFLADCHEKLEILPAWIFISADASPETLLKASRLGAVDILQKPFDIQQIRSLLQRIGERKEDSIHEIMDIVQNISGIRLGKDKRLLVETRLMRRARILGLESVTQYKEYFQKHREKEVDELISAITTHTTSFFREPDHFDYLYDQVLPKLFADGGAIQIWSAASSTGEEIYSLAISVLEYMREKGIPVDKAPKIEILGTDIDFHSVQMARKGIYEFERVERLQASLIKRYFQVGSGELSGFVKVSDEVHRLCRFEQMNLLSQTYPNSTFDVIFIRNVLIYFQTSQIKEIGNKLLKNLNPEGFLFLGHSESFHGMGLPYKLAGNAIYQSLKAKPVQASLVDISAPRIRTLIVDDSMTVRKMLARILTAEHGFEVVGEAVNPLQAEEILKVTQVDLITLDIHMPEMDGITYLQSLQGKPHPPIVMVSSISYTDAVSSLQCFELGAVDYIEKPNGLDLAQEAEKIRLVLRSAAKSRRQSRLVATPQSSHELEYRQRAHDLIVVGASTGGTQAIKNILIEFPANSPPVLIVQHIPAHFSKAFAQRMNEVCKIKVVEAQNGMAVEPGCAYIAPGGFQMKVKAVDGRLQLLINLDAPVNRHRPSVDYTFQSVAALLPDHQVAAVLLTGMGSDGAQGLKSLRDKGAATLVQDEETCVVFGMPKEAIRLDAAMEVLPLSSLPYHIFKSLKNRRAA
jgi:chemotaxis response regulator CheB/chemotaxis methyl-accepting protein methylase